MIFNSVTYIVFLTITVCLYWALPQRARLWMIFISSLVFYGFWRVSFVPVMLLTVVTGHVAALEIQRTSEPKLKKLYLCLSLLINLGLLFYFKYLIFFADNAFGLMNVLGFAVAPPVLKVILPLGISFYTFQVISYIVDVYRGVIAPEKKFVLYGCYVTFFPQLVAGPILRAREVVPQLVKRPQFDLISISEGLRRILYGLFLKVVLADNIAPLVDTGFSQSVATLSAIDVWTLAFLFGFQIYFDFGAYSHIALGSARLMGIHFPENFNFPYIAASPRDFWKRWHISLSSWIRDYLYLPIAGVRVHDSSVGGLATAASVAVAGDFQPTRKTKALFFTWVIMGLWHGANWTFLLWGFYHAVLIFLYRFSAKLVKNVSVRMRSLVGWGITLPLIMLSWVVFRAEDIGTALKMYGSLFMFEKYQWLGMRENSYLVTALLMVGFVLTYLVKTSVVPIIRRYPVLSLITESMVSSIIAGLIFVFLRPINQFIYFQF